MARTPKLTIGQLESLADQIVNSDRQRKQKLARMIRAYARILWIREPKQYKRGATIFADEDGHWDNSYPPDLKYKEFDGPKGITIYRFDWHCRATSHGFYHDLKIYTSDGGLRVCPDGSLTTATIEGTGRYGAFAAHPGHCDFDCSIDYSQIDPEDVALDRLIDAEKQMRDLAFPLSSRRTG
jgi:hypothetical protein